MKTLIDRVKNGARTLAVGAAIGLAGLAYVPRVNGDVYDLSNGFFDLVGTQGTFRTITMNDYPVENLMIRDEYGIDNIVPHDEIEVWRIGFAKYIDGGMIFGGYANNDCGNYPGYEGWCSGNYTDHIFADGATADAVYIVHDKLGDGIGEVVGGVWILGGDDTLYTTKDIEFNGKQGDLSELGAFTDQLKILPHMVINPIVTFNGIPYSWFEQYYDPDNRDSPEELSVRDYWEELSVMDTDEDGHTSFEEYEADTNPTNPASFFRIGCKNGNFTMDSSTNCEYMVYASTNLVNWVVEEENLSGTGGEMIIGTSTNPPCGFYKASVKRVD